MNQADNGLGLRCRLRGMVRRTSPHVAPLRGRPVPRPQIPVIYTGLKPKGGCLLDCLEMHAAGRIMDKVKEKK